MSGHLCKNVFGVVESDGPFVESDRVQADQPFDNAEPLGDLYCPECDYNLRGLTGDRCPECGYELNFACLRESQIPWSHRRRYGVVRAYCRTVWWVTFRRKRLADEIARPVSYPDSQRFRWLTVLIVWATILVGEILWHTLWPVWPTKPNIFGFGWWPMVVANLLGLVCLAMITGVPSYFFHPAHLSVVHQNRAIALSYYTCGALSWAPLAPMFYLFSIPFRGLSEGFEVMFIAMAMLAPYSLGAKWWMDLVHLAKRVTHRSAARLWLAMFGIPVFGVLVCAGVLLVVPGIVGYFTVFLISR